ncbi:hypothetical protein ACGFSG_26035 [Streptomyces sp. NPDC048512]|uniref:hypothetical protein n=1 Tax=unclassified Streptomyces TaxID=2593676 RepID=UPI0009F040B9|nr:hypothetical protein [Streptomyces sp. M41(2017)]OQQ13803.1 hypothetical protein B0675_26585 [Streptomyces sp. M41(2017)]
MTVAGEPLLRLWEGRWVVRRAWIVQYTGAAESTVTRWYTERGRRPKHLRHPEVVGTVGRTVYFDKQAVEAFWAAWQKDIGTKRLGTGRSRGDGQGTRGGGPGRDQRDRAVGVALDVLRREGGPRRGLAAELAREHGGVVRSWRRAVAEAVATFEREQARSGDASS